MPRGENFYAINAARKKRRTCKYNHELVTSKKQRLCPICKASRARSWARLNAERKRVTDRRSHFRRSGWTREVAEDTRTA